MPLFCCTRPSSWFSTPTISATDSDAGRRKTSSRAELEHPTVIQDADAIRQRESFGAIMRNKHRRHAGFLDDALKVTQQLFTAGRVHGREWLVQKQEFRFERERAGQTRPLSFAAR